MTFDSTPTDRYTPAPGTARCPYCAAEVTGIGVPAAVAFAAFRFRCPGCGRPWSEIRDHYEVRVERYYERATAAAGAAQ
jgi:hypothetical protein